MSAKLTVHQLSIERNAILLLEKFDGCFRQGSIVALVGNNGVGKSTLLHCLSGLFPMASGLIQLNDHALHELHPLERAKMIVLLQQVSPFQPYCLAQNRIAHGLMPHNGFSWLSEKCLAHITLLASKLNISHLLNRPLSAMSGGERRLIDIAKVLINEAAQLIVLDEPSVFLDFSQKKVLSDNLIERAKNAIVIFSSHDLDFIESTATDIISIQHTTAQIISVDQFLSSFGARLSKSKIARSGLTPPYNT